MRGFHESHVKYFLSRIMCWVMLGMLTLKKYHQSQCNCSLIIDEPIHCPTHHPRIKDLWRSPCAMCGAECSEGYSDMVHSTLGGWGRTAGKQKSTVLEKPVPHHIFLDQGQRAHFIWNSCKKMQIQRLLGPNEIGSLDEFQTSSF